MNGDHNTNQKAVGYPTLGVTWAVEVKDSWFSSWKKVETFSGDKAEQLAFEYAKRLKNPLIIEIGKQT